MLIRPWLFLLLIPCLHAEGEAVDLKGVLEAFKASDSAKEQNAFCRGSCHLAKFSYRLNSNDIESLGAQNLFDILANFPGLSLSQDEFARPVFGLFGLQGQARMQVYIDGIRQNDPFNGRFLLNLPAQAIDYVDVYYGPSGTSFGEGSLSGVIDIHTKSIPEHRIFGQLSSDLGMGAGLYQIFRKGIFRGSIVAGFEAINQDQTWHYDPHRLKNQDLFAKAMLDAKIAKTAQAHLQVHSLFSQEWLGPYELPNFSANKRTWVNEVHLIKRRAQKNAFDLFLSMGLFEGQEHLRKPAEQISAFNELKEHHTAMRFELGTNFNAQIQKAHNLFFGIGTIFSGLKKGDYVLNNEHQSQEEPMLFGKKPEVFGRNLSLFSASAGHVYGFIEDEWQIRAPLLMNLGLRLILPVESKRLDSELLPHIAITVMPLNKLRLSIAFLSSMRTNTFFEESDQRIKSEVFASQKALVLPPEKSRSIEASLHYQDSIANTEFKLSLAPFLAKVYDAHNLNIEHKIRTEEISMLGLRSMAEVNFLGGHKLMLAIFQTRAIAKNFDEQGYAQCRGGLFISDARSCPLTRQVPSLQTHASFKLDLAGYGALNLINILKSAHEFNNLLQDLYQAYELVYQSKPIARYLVLFTKTHLSFSGPNSDKNKADTKVPAPIYSPHVLATAGFHLSL